MICYINKLKQAGGWYANIKFPIQNAHYTGPEHVVFREFKLLDLLERARESEKEYSRAIDFVLVEKDSLGVKICTPLTPELLTYLLLTE